MSAAAKITPRRRRRSRKPAPRSLFGVQDLRAVRRVDTQRQIGVLVYQGVTTAEIDAPVQALAAALDADVVFIGAAGAREVVGVEPVRTVHVDATPQDPLALKSDILVVPGGLAWEQVVANVELMAWLVHATKAAKGVLAISTGSLLLGSVGALAGRSATGHWLAQHALSELGADVSTERAVFADDERLVTAAGAQAALEVARGLADRVRWGPE